MEITFDWISIVNIIGIVNGIFLSIVILGVKKGHKTTKIILAALITSLSLIILSSFLLTSNLYYSLPHLFGIFPKFYLLVGPFLYLYIKALTESGFTLKKIYILHFIPFFASILISVPFYLRSAQYKTDYIHDFLSNPGQETRLPVFLMLRILHLFIYLLISVKMISTHNKTIKDSHSSIEKIKLSWIQNLILIFTSILFTYILFIMGLNRGDHSFSATERIFTLWEPLMVFIIGYKGMIQTEILSDQPAFTPPAKYQQSRLTDEMSETYKNQLLQIMKTKKPYLDNELTSNNLSEISSIPPRFLSQLLNETFRQNFFDFINRYRFEEARKLLLRFPDKSVLHIAFESGFNSKTAFNTAFQKYSRMTPSQFRQKNRCSDS